MDLKDKIRDVLDQNIYLILNYSSKEEFNEEIGENAYEHELIHIACLISDVFGKYDYLFTRDQRIGVIKHECLLCWDEYTNEDVYEKIYNEIFIKLSVK